eukprot:g2713.t1
MTKGVLSERFAKVAKPNWKEISFKGNAGVVWDTGNEKDAELTVMIVGHADKIRMQVRSIDPTGKIFVNSDSFLPQTLIGNRVKMFSEDAENIGSYREYRGTIEAIGAIHFAPPSFRSGTKGVTPNQLYLELGLHGDKRKEQVEKMGVRPGDTLILDRKIERCYAENTFSGAYLDNGLGCFVTAEVARKVAEGLFTNDSQHVRCLFAYSSHEEIGRFGSRVLAAQLKPDVLIAVDVNHDYDASPIGKEEKYQPLKMGDGYTICVGATASEHLNGIIERSSRDKGIPTQRDVRGRDTGTDGMAAVLGNVDAAVTSLGFPIRNMHTISELAHTGDVEACIDGICAALQEMDNQKMTSETFKEGHPRLDRAVVVENK